MILCLKVRAAAAHKVKDFCLALDKSVQEQVEITFSKILYEEHVI